MAEKRPIPGMRQFVLGMVGYVVALVASRILISSGVVENTAVVAVIALLPVLPFLYSIGGVIAGVRAQDELARQINLEAVLITALLTGALTFSYGLLESAELAPPLSMIWIAPFMVLLWGAVVFFVSRRYR